MVLFCANNDRNEYKKKDYTITDDSGEIPPRKPSVSVIMPVYNTLASYLRDSTESILKQSYPDIELIIINDGSTNCDTIDCLKNISLDNRVTIINNPTNKGISYSLNLAIACSSGDYIARMDSDDIAEPNRIDVQVKYLEKHRDVCLTATRIDFIFEDERGETHYSKPRRYSQDACNVRMLFQNVGYSHPTFMMRRSFIEKNEIQYKDVFSEDYAFLTDCILAGGQLRIIDSILLHYRISNNQFSKIEHNKHVEWQYKISYYRVRNTFEDLTDQECLAISSLGCDKAELSPTIYATAIKKIIVQNRKKRLFDNWTLIHQLSYAWYKKSKSFSRHDLIAEGIMFFTIVSIAIALPSLVLDEMLKTDRRRREII